MKTIMVLSLLLGGVACDKAAVEETAGEHELEVVKCKAGTQSACDELEKACADGKASACDARTRARKPAASAAPAASGAE